MQDDLTAGGTGGVHILGVNAAGQESGNAAMIAGRDLPWLQETLAEPVWGPWNVEWRDVVILDGANRPLAVYNLTEHPLSEAANYAELKALLESAADTR
ncbi:hypothetical protein FJ250_04500 [bacterium]|nr:hypothetical protein [bacterium]